MTDLPPDELEALRLANQELLQRVANLGVNVNLGPVLLDMLIEEVLEGERLRAFQLRWETRAQAILTDMLAQIEQQRRLAILQAPGRAPNGRP